MGSSSTGGTPDLETQALSAIKSSVPMAENSEQAARRLNVIPEYRRLFVEAFGGEASPATIGQDIAAFERTLNTPDYPSRGYLRGDEQAISLEQKRGDWALRRQEVRGLPRGPELFPGDPGTRRAPRSRPRRRKSSASGRAISLTVRRIGVE